MRAILLAATVKDGRDYLGTMPGDITIVTPRSEAAVRGVSVTHIFRTPSFILLPQALRQPLEAVVAPAIMTSDCPYCVALRDHPESQGSST